MRISYPFAKSGALLALFIVRLVSSAQVTLLTGPALTGVTPSGTGSKASCASYANDPVTVYDNRLWYVRPGNRSSVPIPGIGGSHYNVARSTDGIAVIADFPTSAATFVAWIYRPDLPTPIWERFNLPWSDLGLTGAATGAGAGVFVVSGGTNQDIFSRKVIGKTAIANATDLTDTQSFDTAPNRANDPTICELGGRWMGVSGGSSAALFSCTSSPNRCSSTADFYDTETRTMRSVAFAGPSRNSPGVACSGNTFFVAGGRIGGLLQSGLTTVIDIITAPSFSVRTASLSEVKEYIIAVPAGGFSNAALFLGGTDALSDPTEPSDDIELYDGPTDIHSWDTTATAFSRWNTVDWNKQCAVATTDGSVYIIQMHVQTAEFRIVAPGTPVVPVAGSSSTGTMNSSSGRSRFTSDSSANTIPPVVLLLVAQLGTVLMH